MRNISIIDVIQKSYHDERKEDRSEMNPPQKQFYKLLDKETKIKFKEFLNSNEKFLEYEEKYLIGFVLNFIAEVNGKFRNPSPYFLQ